MVRMFLSGSVAGSSHGGSCQFGLTTGASTMRQTTAREGKWSVLLVRVALDHVLLSEGWDQQDKPQVGTPRALVNSNMTQLTTAAVNSMNNIQAAIKPMLEIINVKKIHINSVSVSKDENFKKKRKEHERNEFSNSQLFLHAVWPDALPKI